MSEWGLSNFQNTKKDAQCSGRDNTLWMQTQKPIETQDSGLARHGICQMFYTSKIPEIFNFTQKKCVNCDIFGKKEELRMLYSSILKICQSFL